MVASLKHVAIAAISFAVVAFTIIGLPVITFAVMSKARPKYTVQFVACDTPDCMHLPIVEQRFNWKRIKDGQCKSYLKHTFPGWCYKCVNSHRAPGLQSHILTTSGPL